MIQPKVLKGFRDALPSYELSRKAVITNLEQTFLRYGFVPIDTPVLEYTEVLLGKGGGETDKQIFHFLDNGGRDVALRFDLTVPFARFMAAHYHELSLPFKRYHIAKVWRGENPQKGRYREFYQCDFDIVGLDTVEADTEILLMMQQALFRLGLTDFTIHVSHRGVFNALLKELNQQEQEVEILRIVDKLRKIGPQEVAYQLQELTNEQAAQRILQYIQNVENEKPLTTLKRLETLVPSATEPLQRLYQVFTTLEHLDLLDAFCIDTSITRGLDYYTGIVFETFLNQLPAIGSVCSGGRYNELASLYTKEHLPGVGSSIGLDRLLAALDELNSPLLTSSNRTEILIFNQEEHMQKTYQKWAHQLRSHGLATEVYLQVRKMGPQYKYAETNHISWGLFINTEGDTATVKNLSTRQEYQEITCSDVVQLVNKESQL
ncbi:MAG: histidine--tRNA ligase [Sphaerochaetaceae bacterium]